MTTSSSTRTETTAATTKILMLTRSEVEDVACWDLTFAWRGLRWWSLNTQRLEDKHHMPYEGSKQELEVQGMNS